MLLYGEDMRNACWHATSCSSSCERGVWNLKERPVWSSPNPPSPALPQRSDARRLHPEGPHLIGAQGATLLRGPQSAKVAFVRTTERSNGALRGPTRKLVIDER